MKPTKLHIVSFDVPYPPDYGGAIDIYYKIKSLYEAGAELYLHCYQYGRPEAEELKKYCKEVWYYPRKTGWQGISLNLPYIVYSRRNKQLLDRLQNIDAPILFEGLHTCYYLAHPSLKNRVKAIRTHNIEHEYYKQLQQKEPDLLKQFYFKTESRLLKKFEEHLPGADTILSLSITDDNYFAQQYPKAKHAFIAPFHPYDEISIKPGKGDYCLYHGNLAHGENIEACLYLLNEVFPKIAMPVIIAGRNPGATIIAACKKLPNCNLVPNPSIETVASLIRDAHIHVLPTFQPTGMKLKLLYALFGGRHVLVNSTMVQGTGLDKDCVVAENANAFIDHINRLAGIEFTENDIVNRKETLANNYNNSKNAVKLLTYLQP